MQATQGKQHNTKTLLTWALAMGMAAAGGFVNWYSRVKRGHTRVFNLIELVGEICTSGHVGVGAFMILSSYDQPLGVCAAAAGIGGHMGTRLLFLIEQIFERRLKATAEKD